MTKPAILAILTALLVFWCFYPVKYFSFINFDDPMYVTENEFVRSGLTKQGVAQAFTDTKSGHWHPLTWISHMLDCELFGLNPGAHHLMNVGLHAVSCGLLFLILLMASGSVGPSIAAALIFGLHPMRMESVVWISERKDVLSLLFGLAAIASYIRYLCGFRWFWYGVSILFFVASLLSKPTLVTLPLLLLVLDFWPLRRISARAVKEKIPFLVISILFAVIVMYAQWSGQGLRDLSEISLADRVTGAMVGYLAYFGKFFMPTGYGIFYPFVTFAPGVGAGALMGLIALSYWFLKSWRDRPYLAAGFLWFVIALLPMAGFVQIGGQIFSDRWTYVPHIGLVVASVWYVDSLTQSRPYLGWRIAGIVVLLCVVLTRMNLPYWKDSEILFRRTLEVSPNNFMAHTNLGSYLDKSGNLEKAAFHYEEAVRLNPTYPEALNNLGILRARQNKFLEARDLLTKALMRRPDFIQARYNLGLVFNSLGDHRAAATEWCKVVAEAPGYQAAHHSLQYLVSIGKSFSCTELLAH